MNFHEQKERGPGDVKISLKFKWIIKFFNQLIQSFNTTLLKFVF